MNTIKLTIQDTSTVRDCFRSIQSEHLNPKAFYAIGRNLALLEPILTDFQKRRSAVMKRHFGPTAPSMPNGQLDQSDPRFPAFRDEFQPELDVELDVPIYRFTVTEAELPKTMSTEVLGVLLRHDIITVIGSIEEAVK